MTTMTMTELTNCAHQPLCRVFPVTFGINYYYAFIYSSSYPAPTIQTSFKFAEFNPDTYVDRTFAAKEDLVKELKRDDGTRSVLYFTGPSGTGKTTTLQMLYHHMRIESTNCHLLNAKYDVLGSPIEGGYVFVDDKV